MTTWIEHVNKWKDCQRCPLGQQRDRICFARSEWPHQTAERPNLHLPCDVLFIGEAPGPSEDAAGLPFVGPAGVRMDYIISRAIPSSITFALTNLVLCFPREAKEAGENEPEHGEILACRPRLIEFVNIAQPRLIVRVGKLATRYVNFCTTSHYVDIVHPAYIVRLPQIKQYNEMNRCVVQIEEALRRVMKEPKRKWTHWGENSAEQQRSKRDTLRQVYKDALDYDPDDDIPY